MDEDVLAATSSSDAKLKPRLTMIEQQVGSCVVVLFWQRCFTVLRVYCVACAESAGRATKEGQGRQRRAAQVQDVGPR